MALAVIEDVTPAELEKVLSEQYGIARDRHVKVTVEERGRHSRFIEALDRLRAEAKANGATDADLDEILGKS